MSQPKKALALWTRAEKKRSWEKKPRSSFSYVPEQDKAKQNNHQQEKGERVEGRVTSLTELLFSRDREVEKGREERVHKWKAF